MFADELKTLRIQRRLSQAELADRMGLSKSAIGMYEQGAREPNFSTLETFANYFGVSIDRMLGKPPKDNPTYIDIEGFASIPVIGSIVAGVPRYIDTDDGGTVMVDRRYSGEEYFALKVSGESMSPDLRNGDIILCRKQVTVEPGEMAVICVGDMDATIKMIEENPAGILLIGKNNEVFKPTFYSKQEVISLPIRVIGKAVQIVQRKL